jgi:hypothetical protein
VKRRERADNSFKTAPKWLALLEKEPALKHPLESAGGVSAGSTTFSWRAIPDETGHCREKSVCFAQTHFGNKKPRG